jgi:hypothetical protein
MTQTIDPVRAGAPRGLEALARNRRPITYGLLAAAALLALIPLILLIRQKSEAVQDAVFWWGVFVSLVVAGGALFNMSYEPEGTLTEVEKQRVLVLSLGGLIGLGTTVLGFLLPWVEFREVFAAGLTSWRQHPMPLVWTVAALFGGLALVFISLQLARGVERSSGPMRRLLYGFNAALGVVLLASVLGIINLLPYTGLWPFTVLNRRFDWTSSGMYTLSPSTKSFLAGLREPVKVYVLLPHNALVTHDVERLLENCRTITNEISWEELSRDSNPSEIQKLVKEYSIPSSVGLLVVYGKAPKAQSDFIQSNDLTRGERERRDSSVEYVFTGEAALMKSLRFLAEGKSHAKIYFVQGAGELELNPTGRESGLSELRTRLTQNNYEVKELTFGPDTKGVPADADLVVVARPTRPLSADAVRALRDYLKGAAGGKKGKLLALMGVAVRNGEMVQTGLEPLLAEYGVRVNNDRVICVRQRPHTAVEAVTNPQSENPIAQAFFNGPGDYVAFRFDNVRTVEPAGAGAPNAPTAQELLLLPFIDQFFWSEKDLRKDPDALVQELLQDRKRLAETISRKPLCIAVTVSEGDRGGLAGIPGHEAFAKQEPRMVVFGNAGWVTGEELNRATGQYNYDLFVSCLSWLRGRADVGKQATSEGKERKQYPLLSTQGVNVSRMVYLPLGLLLLTVVGLGCGIWVVRRR